MAVGLKVRYYWYQIGTGAFLHSFYSTVCFNLENSEWGSRFPIIMNELYSGELSLNNINEAIDELTDIKKQFEKLSPQNAVWDIENLNLKAPWGNNISSDITSLGNYFVTSDGEDFITVFFNAFEKAKCLKTALKIESL